MRNNSDLIVKIALLMSDFLVIVASFVAAYVIRVQWDDRALTNEVSSDSFLIILLALVPVWLIIYASLALYKRNIYQSRVEEASRLFFGSAIGVMVIVFVDFLVDEPIYPARLVPVYGFAISYLAVLMSRNVIHYIRSRLYASGIGVKRTLIIASAGAASTVTSLMSQQPTGHKIIGIVGHRPNKKFDKMRVKQYKSLKSALANIKNNRIDTIIQTGLSQDQRQNRKVLEVIQKNHLEYLIYPTFESGITLQSHIELLDGQPVLQINQTPLDGWWRIVKRIIDVIGSGVGLIIALPIIGILGLVIKITDSGGPIIYKHKRLTRYGKTIYIYKMRSMYWKYSTGDKVSGKTDAQVLKEMGRDDLIKEFEKSRKLKNDPRIMPIGKFTRATSLDELPQLINIFKGDLSLVGPRPIAKDELVHYEQYRSLFLAIRPGLTGLWQVSGRSNLSYEERVQLDVYYIQNWSIILDLKILLKTIAVVLRRVGSR